MGEFRTSRKYYGNLKNEGSPEFRVGVFPSSDFTSNSRPSLGPTPVTIPPSTQQNATDFEQQRRAQAEEAEIEMLKAELRKREEEIRQLVERERNRRQQLCLQNDQSRSLSPLELYHLGTQSKTPANTRPFNQLDQSPYVKPHSLSPFRSAPHHPQIFHSNSTLSSNRPDPYLHDLAYNPLYRQPRYTTHNPKVHVGDPITGLSRDIRKGFSDYGNMLISHNKPTDAYRKLL